MAGHIILATCLLAICLPIICVQLPRFDNVKELHAENEAETRSTILQGRSPSPRKEALRRNSRSQSEADVENTIAKTRQEQSDTEGVVQAATEQHERTSAPWSTIQGDACADGGASSNKHGTKAVRADRKPWDPPFRRYSPTNQLEMEGPGRQGHAENDTSLPRKTGQDLEARGVAKRLFPPDPVLEMDFVDGYDRPRIRRPAPLQPQEPLHRRLAKGKQSQGRESAHKAMTPECEPQCSVTKGVPSQCTGSESLPSPFDVSPLPSACHAPRIPPPTENRRSSCCHHRHCRHGHSDTSHPHSPIVPPAATKEASETPSQEVSEPPTKGTYKDNIEKEAPTAVRIAHKASRVPWRTLLVVLGLITYIFAFAILIAHCLAWFLVYKTEARLGEVRRGLLRGGEMRLCLCGKG